MTLCKVNAQGREVKAFLHPDALEEIPATLGYLLSTLEDVSEEIKLEKETILWQSMQRKSLRQGDSWDS